MKMKPVVLSRIRNRTDSAAARRTAGKRNLIKTVLAALLGLTTTLCAQDTPAVRDQPAEPRPGLEPRNSAASVEDPWQFSVVPLLWLSGVNGNVTVNGHKADVDVGFDQLFQHFNGGFMADFDLRKSKFGFYVQPNYMQLGAGANAGPFSGNDDITIWIVEGGGYYQFAKWGEDKPLTLEAVVGVRYWSLHNDFTLRGSGGIVNFSGSDSTSLVDPLVGLHVQKYLTEKLSVTVRGDVGGFGISNHSSDLSWQAVALIGYDFTRHFALYAGYRALALREGSGSGSGQKGADLVLNGALIGLDFHW
jgi:hypothetical protein